MVRWIASTARALVAYAARVGVVASAWKGGWERARAHAREDARTDASRAVEAKSANAFVTLANARGLDMRASRARARGDVWRFDRHGKKMGDSSNRETTTTRGRSETRASRARTNALCVARRASRTMVRAPGGDEEDRIDDYDYDYDANRDEPFSPDGDAYERMLAGESTPNAGENDFGARVGAFVRAFGREGGFLGRLARADADADADVGTDPSRAIRDDDSAGDDGVAFIARAMLSEGDHGLGRDGADPEELNTSPDVGLSERDARARREKYGANETPIDADDDRIESSGDASTSGGRARWLERAVREELKNPAIRAAGACVALELAQSFNASASARDDPVFNAFILSALIVVNACVSNAERADASRASRELQRMVDARATTVREGRAREMDARELVPGDIVILRPGCAVPADCVSCGPRALVLDNSAITGERRAAEASPGEPLFARAVVKRGNARAVVVRTGKNTFAARAARVVRKREARTRETSAFEARVRAASRAAVAAGAACSLSVFVYLIVSGRDFFRSLSFCVVLVIWSAPLAVRTIVSTTTALGARALALKSAIVARASVVEDLATMNVLCVETTGTLTRDATSLNAIAPTVPLLEGVRENDVMTAAAMCAKWNEPPTSAVDAMIADAFDVSRLAPYSLVEHRPFDATAHRRYSESVVAREDGSTFRVMKGPVDVALTRCVNAEDVRALISRAMERVQSRASRGVISRALLVACSDARDDPYVALGLVVYEDVRRRDADETIRALRALGVDVKIVTGDGERVARVTCEKTRVDHTELRGPADVPYVPLRTSVLHPRASASLAAAAAYRDMLPEDTRALIAAHRAKGDVVGLVSAAASDAAALRLAHVGVAAHDAADAARAAADLVLAAPSLAVVALACTNARVMFARVREYVIFRTTCAVHILGFFVLAAIFVRPASYDAAWPETFTLPVVAACVSCALNDIVVVGAAYDHASPSRLPERFRLAPDVVACAASGATACASSLACLVVAASTAKTYGEAQTCAFLKLILTDAMTVFSARTRESFVSRRPGGLLVAAFALAAVVACAAANAWPLAELTPTSPARVSFVISFAMVSLLAQDFVKTTTYRALARAGWSENVGVVTSAEIGRLTRAARRATPRRGAATTETTVETVETPRRTPRDAVLESDDEEAAIPLLSEDEGEDDAHGEDGDDEEEESSFYSDYGGASETASYLTVNRAPEVIAATIESETDTPRFERLRRAPGYCAATLSDATSVAESHDWWTTFAALQRERAKDASRARGDDDDNFVDEEDEDEDDASTFFDDASSVRTRRRATLPADALAALDFGCGVGAFSAALCRRVRDDTVTRARSPLFDPAMKRLCVSVDLLDVSGAALHAASASLEPPFRVGTLHRGTPTSFVPPRDAVAVMMEEREENDDGETENGASVRAETLGYDVVYSAHGFATVPRGKLRAALRNFRASIRPGGLGFIAAYTEQSHDARFFAMYHAERSKRLLGAASTPSPPPPARAEHICDALSAQGVSYNVEVKSHATVVDVSDGSLEGLEAYLHGVAMDDALSVDTMTSSSALGAYLASCLTPDGRAYSFPQRVAHVTM